MVRPDRDEHARATPAGIHRTPGRNVPEKERARVEVGHLARRLGGESCPSDSSRSEALGRPIGAMDAFLAATAQTHCRTRVTRNVSDFPLLKAILSPWTDPGIKG